MDDGVTAVGPARATHFMEVWVQQQLQTIPAAPYARVMQLNFKRLQRAKELTHGGAHFASRIGLRRWKARPVAGLLGGGLAESNDENTQPDCHEQQEDGER